jgi:hypothetical protein
MFLGSKVRPVRGADSLTLKSHNPIGLHGVTKIAFFFKKKKAYIKPLVCCGSTWLSRPFMLRSWPCGSLPWEPLTGYPNRYRSNNSVNSITVVTNKRDFFIIPAYLESVQVHSVNWLKEVDECLGEGRSLALFYN